MIVDCFPFFNELDLLEIRLNILKDVVDKFVLVEASKTQTKLDKPFYFEDHKDRFADFLDRIVHVKVTDYPNQDGWAMENYQRICISNGIDTLELKDDDIIAVSDVDEIWNPVIANTMYNLIPVNRIISVDMVYRVFYLNLETVDKRWVGTVFTDFKSFKQMPSAPQKMRNNKDFVLNIPDRGWHFGYQGGKEKVYQKWLSCIEPFDKSKIPDKDIFFAEFDKRIKDNGSFIYSDNITKEDIKLMKVTDDNLPEYVKVNKDLYTHMIV